MMHFQIFAFLLVVPTTKSLFRDICSLPVKRRIDSNNFGHERQICSSKENIRQNDDAKPPHTGTRVNEWASPEHQNLDSVNGIGEGEGLVFEGKFNYESETVPIPTSLMSSPAGFDFFLNPSNRDLVIKGGGNQCEKIPMTPELHNEWTLQSKIVNSIPPDGSYNGPNQNKEEILAVYSEVPIVPGLSLRAISYTGCKTMKEPTSALPYYEFTLLKESYQPVGKKAMKWIFDKVTGNSNRYNKEPGGERTDGVLLKNENEFQLGKGDSHGRTTCAISRVMLKPLPQDGGCKICYYGHVKLTLSKKFLHILPLPTKVVQKKVNKSIRKQLERECTRSINKFSAALNQWVERGTSANNGALQQYFSE